MSLAAQRLRPLLLATLVMLVGCGSSKSSGSPSDTIRGTAAAGSPIIGTITLKDSSSPALVRSGRIAADGTYTLDTTGLKAPFMMRADGTVGGKAVSLYSAGVEADVNGRINITPFTDLIVANVAHDLAATYFEGGAFSGLTKAQLDDQAAALRAKLMPVLAAVGLDGSLDLLRQSFAADHSGLDAVLDVVRVSVDEQTKIASVTNILDGSTVTNAITTGSLQGDLTASTVADGVSTMRALSDDFARLNALFATRLPTVSELAASGAFDAADFLNGGEDWAAFSYDLSSGNGWPVGGRVENLAIDEVVDANTTWITFTGGSALRWLARRDPGSGRWLLAGDRCQYSVQIWTHATYYAGSSRTFDTGYLMSFTDPASLLPLGSYVDLHGPGVSGARFYKTIDYDRFTQVPGQDRPMVALSDQAIAAIPEYNPAYTIDVYSVTPGATTLVDSITVHLPRKPLPQTALPVSAFMSASALSPTSLQGFAGGTVTATFSVPQGLTPGWFFVHFSDAAGAHHADIDGTFDAAGTSGTVVAPASTFSGWTTAHAYAYAGGADVFGREFETELLLF
jgi:hypothetical protein